MIAVNARFLTRNITGVERFAIEISLRLKKIFGDKIVFVAPSNVVQKLYGEKLDVKIIGSHVGHRWEQFDLPRYLKNNGKPLLLNLCNTAPLFYSNKLTVLHDITYIRFPKTYSRAFRTFYKVMMPLLLKTSKYICSVSEFSKQEISSHYKISEKKIKVIYNAVDAKFKPTRDSSLKEKPYFLAVSSLKESKNFLMILRSFSNAAESLADVHLKVVGDLASDSFAGMDLSIYKNDPRIQFLGRVSDSELVKLYSNAEAFLFPSLYEGFGIPVLEAQACGCPVISSNAASLPEVLSDSALLVDPNSLHDWETGMKTVCGKDGYAERLVSLGFENVNRFSWECSAQQITDLIW